MTSTSVLHRPPLTARSLCALDQIRVLPCRILLETPGVAASVPMLRGVWGAALRARDRSVYDWIFEGKGAPGQGKPHEATPLYVLRPAPPDPAFAPAMECILLADAVTQSRPLVQAWHDAGQRGLGPKRHPFSLRRWLFLDPAGRPVERGGPWRLGQGAWPCDPPETTPCRLRFDAPLRLRRHGRLIEQPSLADLVVAATRRVGPFLPPDEQVPWKNLGRELLELARRTPQEPWRGDRLDLTRYSGRQGRELDLHGVSGSLALPEGPGPLWPLLLAACWLHLGKGTVMGLGQLRIMVASIKN